MHFEITHKTIYTYNRPVFLEAHWLRLAALDAQQNLTYFDLKVVPAPLGSSDGVDLDGNVTANIWFEGLTEKFVVESRAKVFTRYRNPFHYLLLGERADRLPISYLDPIRAYLAPYTVRQNESHLVEQFARHIANSTEWKTVRFLTAFNREIYECCRQTVHEHGEAQPAEATLLRKSGSPRDLALLFIEGCRYLGIAARFVNGYHENNGNTGKRYLHSWGEVYLPGVGWRGYDPSQGLAVTDRHIALAAAGIPVLAAPVIGTFRGNAVTSELIAEIDIRVVADNEINLAATVG